MKPPLLDVENKWYIQSYYFFIIQGNHTDISYICRIWFNLYCIYIRSVSLLLIYITKFLENSAVCGSIVSGKWGFVEKWLRKCLQKVAHKLITLRKEHKRDLHLSYVSILLHPSSMGYPLINSYLPQFRQFDNSYQTYL